MPSAMGAATCKLRGGPGVVHMFQLQARLHAARSALFPALMHFLSVCSRPS